MYVRSSFSAALAFCLGVAACGNGQPATDASACLAGQLSVGGLCAGAPRSEAERTRCGDVTEFCDKSGHKQPLLQCLTDAPRVHPRAPATVTLTGFVRPFSGGSSNALVTIQIFKAADLPEGADLAKATPIAQRAFAFDPTAAIDATQFRACDRTPAVGCVPINPSACRAPVCFDGLSGRKDEQKYCHLVNGTGVCSDRLRWERRYAIDGVPTNTPLVIRTTGDSALPSPAWNTLVQSNVFLATDDPSCGGDTQATDCLDTTDMIHPRYQLNVSVLSQSDYLNLPKAAGLSGGMTPSEGAIVGEVHDCENVRVANVQIAVKPAHERLAYWSGSPSSPQPDPNRSVVGTDRLGLYSLWNVAPGKVRIEAVGLSGGAPVSLGAYTAIVYPATVSVVNLNGGRPQQTP